MDQLGVANVQNCNARPAQSHRLENLGNMTHRRYAIYHAPAGDFGGVAGMECGARLRNTASGDIL